MASLVPDIISSGVGAEQYEKEAMDIVFSLPELTRDEQAELLAKSGDGEMTLEIAGQAIDIALRTF